LLEFNDDAHVLVGVEMGASHVEVVVTNLRARVRTRVARRHPVVAEPASTLALIEALIDEAIASAGVRTRQLLGIGVAVPCPLDLRNPEHLCRQLMPAWDGVNVTGALAQRFGCAVAMDNDANLGALAERWWGVGTTGEDLTYIKVATGVGAGHIIAGEVYRGSNGTAGEIGHLAIDLHGPPCRCGLRGCLAALVGAGALEERVASKLSGAPDSILRSGDRTIDAIAAAASGGDRLAQEVVAEAGVHLGVAIASLLNLLNPAIVVLGGPLTAAGDVLLAPIRETIQRRSLWRSVAEARIVTSELGDAAVAVGAATRVLETALKSPVLFAAPQVARAG